MSYLKPILFSVAGVGVIGAAAAYFLGLKKFSDSVQVTTDTSFEVTKRLLGVPIGFNMIVTPTIKNPTGTELSMSQPYVELRLSESAAPIATSQLSDSNYKIKSLGQLTFDPIILPISLTSSISDIASFAKNSVQTKKIQVFIKVITMINKDSVFPIRVEQPTVKELTF